MQRILQNRCRSTTPRRQSAVVFFLSAPGVLAILVRGRSQILRFAQDDRSWLLRRLWSIERRRVVRVAHGRPRWRRDSSSPASWLPSSPYFLRPASQPAGFSRLSSPRAVDLPHDHLQLLMHVLPLAHADVGKEIRLAPFAQFAIGQMRRMFVVILP